MTEQELNQLISAHAMYKSMFDEHYGGMVAAGKHYANELKKAFAEMYPEETSNWGRRSDSDYRWINFYDFVRVEFDDDNLLQIQYWQEGRCGDSDECLHSIQLTPRLLSTDKVQEMIQSWKEAEQKKIIEEQKKANVDKLKKIKELEEQLKELKNN